MAIGYNTKIAANGLAFCVDPANIKSYPGSGTVLSDLTRNGNDGTLTNGPTYDSANGGSIVFDGTDDFVTHAGGDFSIVNNLFADANGAWTVSAWFKFPTTPAGTRTGNQSWVIVGRAGGIATGGTWKQTSYNGNMRKRYAGIGYTYNADLDAFVPPKPFASWVLNNETADWEAPVPMPTEEGKRYAWNEETGAWDEVEGMV